MRLGILGVWLGVAIFRYPQMPLSEAACRNAKSTDRPYKMADGEGLYLYVTTTGSRLWRMKYRFGGKEKVLSFGPYPAIGLAEARTRRLEAKARLARGIDPGTSDRDEPSELFQVVAEEWFTAIEKTWVPGYANRIRSRLEADVYPQIGQRAIETIEPPDILALLRKIEGRGALEVAKRIKQVVGSIFRYAVATGRAKRDPTADLRGALRPRKVTRHFAKLPANDIGEFVSRLRSYDGDPVTALAIELVLHTWVRTNEIRFGRRDEVVGRIWRIPAARMKMSRDHIVPLSDQAAALISRLVELRPHSDWIAPGLNGPMSENTMIYAMYRMGYHSRATVHGLRGTASTICNESGLFNEDWIERQLAHVHGDAVRSAYNAAEYLDHRTRMMQWWSDLIDTKTAEYLAKQPKDR